MTLDQELSKKMGDIRSVFDLNSIASLNMDQGSIRQYYRLNKIPYSLFHSKSDLLHMGISRDGKFKEADLLEQARIVEDYIKTANAKNVLELATGRGTNSYYLAQRFSDVRFDGIDLTPTQLKFAEKKARKVNNYFPVLGDYHQLQSYDDNFFDVIFEVEAVCYSIHKEKMFAEARRVLKKDGLFILFDGYLRHDKKEMTDNEFLASRLIEKGMAVQEFEEYSSFTKKAKQNNFIKVREEDLSEYVLPTMYNFEKLAMRFFRHDLLARTVAKIIPREITYNAISGYLMPVAMKKGIFCYMLTVLRKT